MNGKNQKNEGRMSFTLENMISYGLVFWMVAGFFLMGLNIW